MRQTKSLTLYLFLLLPVVSQAEQWTYEEKEDSISGRMVEALYPDNRDIVISCDDKGDLTVKVKLDPDKFLARPGEKTKVEYRFDNRKPSYDEWMTLVSGHELLEERGGNFIAIWGKANKLTFRAYDIANQPYTKTFDLSVSEDQLEKIYFACDKKAEEQIKLKEAQTFENIHRFIEIFWKAPTNIPKGLAAKIAIELSYRGEVENFTLLESSGNQDFDDSLLSVLKKLPIIPIPDDPVIKPLFYEFELTFKPQYNQKSGGKQGSAVEAPSAKETKERNLGQAISEHAGKLKQHVESFWNIPYDTPRGLRATLTIRLNPIGEVRQASVANRSGHPAFDKAAIVAVLGASPLPMPDDPEVAEKFRYFNFVFEPR